jgi:hypothetical protein
MRPDLIGRGPTQPKSRRDSWALHLLAQHINSSSAVNKKTRELCKHSAQHIYIGSGRLALFSFHLQTNKHRYRTSVHSHRPPSVGTKLVRFFENARNPNDRAAHGFIVFAWRRPPLLSSPSRSHSLSPGQSL